MVCLPYLWQHIKNALHPFKRDERKKLQIRRQKKKRGAVIAKELKSRMTLPVSNAIIVPTYDIVTDTKFPGCYIREDGGVKEVLTRIVRGLDENCHSPP
jgi:hypothetical protein